MLDSVRCKLVTIIAAAELQDTLGEDLVRLGVGAYTTSLADGRGKTGLRMRGFFEISNMRLEAIVPAEKAEAIMAHLSQVAETLDIVAFCQDIDAIPRRHFV
jgi:nitrogen regulatory protein PII